jgi:hypothetical protein
MCAEVKSSQRVFFTKGFEGNSPIEQVQTSGESNGGCEHHNP